ncbi:MAG: alpha/beta fold hydrolase [Hahellaceae bacterium]|nr:alpha/beta fold hydrolase [Hahellaceae bacterium]MCP5168768.1 alpha/beta fold hydrolase [Hahellaceae bacterium]
MTVFRTLITSYSILRLIFFCASAAFFSGCSSLLFYPYPAHVFTPEEAGVNYQDIYLESNDGVKLHGWLLNAPYPPKGIVYYLHGNAENISTHVANVIWLPERGYSVFCLDYRGFGKSEGSPELSGAILDAATGYHWVTHQPEFTHTPKYLMGQSMGAAITIVTASAQHLPEDGVKGIVIDAGLTGFRAISREKLGQFWLTWPFQYPLSWLITNDYEPIESVSRLSPTPTLFIHSTQDEIIPYAHGMSLFKAARPPKALLTTETRHTATFAYQNFRETLLKFLDDPIAFTTAKSKSQ